MPECKKLLLNREGVDGQVLDLDTAVKDGVLWVVEWGLVLNLSEIPSVFICPISLEPMEDPVTLCTGQTNERSNILKWFSLGRSIDIQFRLIG
ncbi:putative U box domain, Zinc finger, RING/FYVE/PHD-type [Helianthus anomalus]